MDSHGDRRVFAFAQGRFLTLKSKGASSQEHCDAMWYWLQGKGVSAHRSGIVQCLVEKLEIMMPSLYS